MTNCDGVWTDLLVDHGNRGACGTRCSQISPDYTCVSGACAAYFTPGLMSCNGVCVDLQSNAHNCGTCGNACGSNPVHIPGTGGNLPDLIPRPCINGRCSLPF